jgi:hypothetical protein
MSHPATTFIGSIVRSTTPPDKPGSYLLLAWEWVGVYSDRPRDPRWRIRHWDGARWESERYTFDTGNYENFEPYAWSRLPPDRPQFAEE